MSRFDVYPGPATGGIGYVLDVQADLLSDLETRVVVPLLPPEHAPTPARTLDPTVAINGQPHLILTQLLATVPARHLSNPCCPWPPAATTSPAPLPFS